MTATPPKPSLVKTTALSMAQAVTDRLNTLMPTVQSAESPVTVYQAGTLGVGSQLSAPTSAFPAGAGYYGVWTAPDLNNGSPYTVQVECFGGGGGGGGGSASTGGGGGGGGEYAAETYYPVKPGTSYAWQVGVPGSPGTANSTNDQATTAGGPGGTTIFDIAGVGVAGGVTASGGAGGDTGNTGIGGPGGSGSLNTVEYGGGTGGTNVSSGSGGGGGGGTGGSDNPLTLFSGGMLSASPVAWYIMNDASSNGQVNDSSGNRNAAVAGSWNGTSLVFDLPFAPPQVPAYTGGGNPPGAPNPTVAGALLEFPLRTLTQPSGYIQTPGIFFQNSQLTISGWVYPDLSGTWGNTATGSRAVLAANTTGYVSGHASGGALYMQNNGTPSNPNWTLNWYCGNGSSSQVASHSFPATSGQVFYVVATFSSGAMTLYVNGASVATAAAGFSSVPGGNYSMTLGMSPQLGSDWFFGYMSNFWIANGVLNSSGVTQAYAGSGGGGGGSPGGSGGGASGGPATAGGAGSPASGSTGGAGGVPAVQPTTSVGFSTPASAGIAGAAGGSGNAGITGAAGAGGGGAGASASPPGIVTLKVPFTTAASYCGTDASGGAAGGVYNPVIQGTTGRLFTGGQPQDAASGSKNSLLVMPPNLAATFAGGTVLRVTLTVFNAYPQALQNALMQVGWSTDGFLPITYTAADLAGSAGVVEITRGTYSVTADLTESQLGYYIASGGATALVLGPGQVPSFAAYNSPTAADFYTAVYGPGATDSAGNDLSPYLTITYATSATVQQGSPGGAGAILVTYLNQSQTLVGHWTAADGINASGGQLTETTIVLGSTIKDTGRLGLAADEPAVPGGIDDMIRLHVAAALRDMITQGRLGVRLGAVPGAPGTLLGYTAGTTTVSQTTPGTYTFTVPSGVTALAVSCWGAGAGATGGSSAQGQAGGGGGGYSAEPSYAVTPGQVISYTVGAGGAGDHVGTNSGPDGGNTVFDSTHLAGSGVTANGGKHYNGSLNYAPGGGTSGNTVSFSGGNGGYLITNQVNGSGGGGSAGSAGNGGAGSQGITHGSAGAGGGAVGGNGSTNGSGSSGSAPGGGGGGASRGTSAFTGGSGASGKISIVYVATTALNTSIATASGTDAAGNPYPAGVMTNALQVNGTTTTTNQTVSSTTTTNVLAVTTNASVGGNHTVTGNVAVGGVITGPSGGTLESSSNFHASGSGQFDSGVVTAGVSSSAQVAAPSMNVNGSGSSAQLAINGNTHGSGSGQFDSSLSTSGQVSGSSVNVGGSGSGATVAINGNVHASSTGQFDGGVSTGGDVSMGSMNGASLPQGAVSSPSVTNPPGSLAVAGTNDANLKAAVDGLINRLRAIGVIP